MDFDDIKDFLSDHWFFLIGLIGIFVLFFCLYNLQMELINRKIP